MQGTEINVTSNQILEERRLQTIQLVALHHGDYIPLARVVYPSNLCTWLLYLLLHHISIQCVPVPPVLPGPLADSSAVIFWFLSTAERDPEEEEEDVVGAPP